MAKLNLAQIRLKIEAQTTGTCPICKFTGHDHHAHCALCETNEGWVDLSVTLLALLDDKTREAFHLRGEVNRLSGGQM